MAGNIYCILSYSEQGPVYTRSFSTAPDPQGLSYSLGGLLYSPNAIITNTDNFSCVFGLQNINLDCVVSAVFFSI